MLSRALIGLLYTGLAFAQSQSHPLEQALSLFNSGQYQKSFELLSLYTQQHPQSGNAWKIFGMTHFMLGRPEEAIIALQKAVQLSPLDADAYYYLGRLYFSKDNAAEALPIFQKSIELNPQSVRAWNHLGQTYEALGRLEEAESAYQKAISVGKNQPKRSEWPYYNLAQLYVNTSKMDQAIPLFREALKYNPRFADAKVKLAVALSKREPSVEALTLMQEAVQLEPQNAEAHYRLGLLLAKMGKQEEANQQLTLFRQLKNR